MAKLALNIILQFIFSVVFINNVKEGYQHTEEEENEEEEVALQNQLLKKKFEINS